MKILESIILPTLETIIDKLVKTSKIVQINKITLKVITIKGTIDNKI